MSHRQKARHADRLNQVVFGVAVSERSGLLHDKQNRKGLARPNPFPGQIECCCFMWRQGADRRNESKDVPLIATVRGYSVHFRLHAVDRH